MSGACSHLHRQTPNATSAALSTLQASLALPLVHAYDPPPATLDVVRVYLAQLTASQDTFVKELRVLQQGHAQLLSGGEAGTGAGVEGGPAAWIGDA